jgi:hypothetical protein
MSTEQITTPGEAHQPDPVLWAAPRTEPQVGQTPTPGPRRRWSVPKIVAAAVAAVVIAVGGGVAVSNISTGTSTTQGPGGAGAGPGQGAPGAGGFGGAGAIHSDAVISDGNGGYTTRRTQTGTVTAVSGSSITVKSADDFSSTYAITSSTTVDSGSSAVSDIQTGDTVSVVGTVSGNSATATALLTGSAATNQGPGGGQGPGGLGQGTTTN